MSLKFQNSNKFTHLLPEKQFTKSFAYNVRTIIQSISEQSTSQVLQTSLEGMTMAVFCSALRSNHTLITILLTVCNNRTKLEHVSFADHCYKTGTMPSLPPLLLMKEKGRRRERR